MNDHDGESAIADWRSYEHLHGCVHCSNECLDLQLDCLAGGEWVDSHSSSRGCGISHFTFRSRQTCGLAYRELILFAAGCS
jgi:hypothetical protein